MPALKYVNKLVYGTRDALKYLGESVTGTAKGFGKEMMRLRLSVIFGIFGMDAGRCADKLWWFCCTCAVVFPPERLEQTIGMALYDVMRVSHSTVGGNYKRRA